MSLEITRVGPEAAPTVLPIIREAFAARPVLDPPADALGESEESVARLLQGYGGLLATRDGEPLGTLVLDPVGRTVFLRRFAVLPSAQGHGVAHALVAAAAAVAADDAAAFVDLAVVAREELPRTVRFWERQGFREISRTSPSVLLHRPLRTHVFEVPQAEDMRRLGVELGRLLGAGDRLVLSGELGAGKTTFTQGLGAGLGVRGGITSPTFVIARVHPSEVGGPELVHVDAYRLGGLDELDDLDLDASLDEAVTVVEWGEGLAEGLAESRLEVRIVRALTVDELAEATGGEGGLDPRRVEITPVGPRWHAVDWSVLDHVVDDVTTQHAEATAPEPPPVSRD